MNRRASRPRFRGEPLAISPLVYLSSLFLLPLLFLLPAACPAACPLPTFTAQPQNQTVAIGGSAAFSATAVSAGCTVSYQWYGAQGLISGATSSSYTINPVSAVSAGNYYTVASVIGSSRQSTNAVLTVYPPYTFATLAGSTNSGSADGPGNAARFYYPAGVAVDRAGNVYVADQDNHTIRQVTLAGVVTTLAGSPGVSGTNDGPGSAARFYYPADTAVDRAGNVYVADYYNHTIRQVTPVGTNWVVTTVAGLAGSSGSTNGTGSAARFNYPAGVAVDTNGNVYVADQYNDTIRQVTPAGVVTTLAGLAGSLGSADGTGSAARFARPAGVAVDTNGNVYVADYLNDTIRKVAPVGTNWVVTTLAGLAGTSGNTDGTGSAARFANPSGTAVDANGNVYVADSANNTIRQVTPAGAVTTLAGLAGSPGSADGTGSAARFFHPTSVAVDTNGNVYAADYANYTIRKGAVSVGPPVILLQPQSQTLNQGTNVTFGVTATGTVPLSYQWRFNDTSISSATGSVYTITNVQPSQAGSYSVLASNTIGVATSPNAVLAVDTNTTVYLSFVDLTTNGFQFQLSGPVGIYVIQASSNLVNWLPFATNSTRTGLWDYTDPGAIGVGRRFYRALLQ